MNDLLLTPKVHLRNCGVNSVESGAASATEDNRRGLTSCHSLRVYPLSPSAYILLGPTIRCTESFISILLGDNNNLSPDRLRTYINMGLRGDADAVSVTSIDKDVEKVDQIEIYNRNKYARIGLTDEDADFYTNYPEDARKKLFKKIDFRLVPVLAVLYLFAHIDRANIGNAKIEGMVEDLGMTGIQYNIA